MKIKIVNKSKYPLPEYETPHSAGLDIRANIDEPITLERGERTLVPTGLFIELPVGYEAQIRPRSGLAIKYGISLVNSPGTIDSDYRGEIRIIVINHSKKSFKIIDGERICQMIVSKYEQVEWDEVKKLDQTIRGNGGFGHTGV
ncbi:MAG: dUTP diphosphatase [Candidatus Azobacteroides pseudotrichonymphae]|jgi:dUTP pyrophosphatase|nr:dUTP diphosphatase [Bacteroidales bacterium OttesenSCG-928-I14]GMO36186.1 MAG: dUTP diphosphatase [Candidatus Azobacteroides pseudotrichonymphae]